MFVALIRAIQIILVSVMLMLRTNGLLCMYHYGFDDGRLLLLSRDIFIS